MERENARMLEHEEILAEKRLKLDYKDLVCDSVTSEAWDNLLARNCQDASLDELRERVSNGVPKTRRGELWQLIINKQIDSDEDAKLIDKFPNSTLKYDVLKSQLTCHKLTILIDLARTFPNHG